MRPVTCLEKEKMITLMLFSFLFLIIFIYSIRSLFYIYFYIAQIFCCFNVQSKHCHDQLPKNCLNANKAHFSCTSRSVRTLNSMTLLYSCSWKATQRWPTRLNLSFCKCNFSWRWVTRWSHGWKSLWVRSTWNQDGCSGWWGSVCSTCLPR